MRSVRNCDDESNENIGWSWAPGLRRCPWSVIERNVWTAVKWWQSWKLLGLLPYPGDLGDQPNYVYQVIERCEVTLRNIEAARTNG